ncbi:hypothetical protein [Sphingobacterium sp. JB170]|uniref:hypothetical protein n=1 Tax=Sphingobacterium sp. JB170 TaxID=1434842 RepID=UPI001C4EA0BE|nr:hypothetical protein [Sphingobacterium sp. JB170]
MNDIQYLVQNTRISISISDSTGSFTFNGRKEIEYKLGVEARTRATKILNISVPMQIEQTYYVARQIELKRNIIGLKEISATGSRLLVRQEIDRIAYSVQSTLNITQKMPLMAVDDSNNVKREGIRNFKVLLNAKPSAQLKNHLTGALSTISANRIERFEVITSHPAKYDSENLPGLVNVVILENNVEEFKRSISAAYNNQFAIIGSTSVTDKNRKICVDGFLFYLNVHQLVTAFGGGINFPKNGRSIAQNGTQKYNGDVQNVNLQLNCEIDALNTLIVRYNTKLNDFYRMAQLQQNIMSSDQGISNFIDQNSFANWRSTDVVLNYQHIFKDKKYKTFNFRNKHANTKNDITDNNHLWSLETSNQSDAFDQQNKTQHY